MTRATDLTGWEHSSGYRLNADGASIEYERDDGARIWVEGMVIEDEHDPSFGYWGLFKGPDGEELDGPKMWRWKEAKEDALEWLDETMESNQLTEPGSYDDVYERLDGTYGPANTLNNALHWAAEDGHAVESADDTLADVRVHLERAWELIDADEIDMSDADDVKDSCEAARRSLHDFKRKLEARNLDEYEPPEHVDTGVYDTLGEYTQYVLEELHQLEGVVEEWWFDR